MEFSFESDALAELFVERLKFYLSVEGTQSGTRVTLIVAIDDEKKISDIERLARGSYASFTASNP